MADDLETTIRQAAENPASVSAEIGSATQHNLKDLIEADKHLARKAAARGKSLGIRLARLTPPGMT